MSELEPLSGTLAELVAAEQPVVPLSEEKKAALLARLAQTIPQAALSLAPAAGTSTAPALAGAGFLPVLKGKLLPVACLLIGAAAGALGQRALYSQREAMIPMARRRAGIEVVVVAAPAPERSFDPPRPIVTSTPTTTPAIRSVSSRATSSVAGDLERERLLLGAARTALRRGDVIAAKAALAQHQQSFPQGQLAAERDMLAEQFAKVEQGALPLSASARTIP